MDNCYQNRLDFQHSICATHEFGNAYDQAPLGVLVWWRHQAELGNETFLFFCQKKQIDYARIQSKSRHPITPHFVSKFPTLSNLKSYKLKLAKNSKNYGLLMAGHKSKPQSNCIFVEILTVILN
jgi:hypothetical protein